MGSRLLHQQTLHVFVVVLAGERRGLLAPVAPHRLLLLLLLLVLHARGG